jgi:serine phosphatase RsbU (regulator of sigma subunit)
VTTCFGILDPKTCLARYVSAGHGPLLWFHAERNEVDLFGATGLPMAVTDDSSYVEGPVITFEPGDLFLLLTDGFTEWSRPDGEMYGEDRLIENIRRHREGSCADLIQTVYQDVRRFSEGTLQLDDLTAVVIKRKP